MKNTFIKIASYLFLLFLVSNCATIKNFKSNKSSNKTNVSKNENRYVPLPKLERKNFFKDSNDEDVWVDSIYTKMSFEDKAGQLFMVAGYSNKDSTKVDEINIKLIKENKIGGIIFFNGSPVRQVNLTNKYQAISKIPLFIGNDAEWGLSMRLDSTYRYPWNMTLGSIKDLKLIENVGENMGQECKRMGIHFNFAPVIDINTNPKNPIIGFRSFGENKYNVTENAIALMTGIQKEGVFATGKHFPGHGDTDQDSHKTLPTIKSSREHLDQIELYPYKRMFDEGLASVMVAHLNVPSLELRQNYPSSISYSVVTNLLKKDLGFNGLIFTDALNMKGASNFDKPGEIDLQAFLAGNDILLFSENVPLAIEKIKTAYQEGIISEERLSFSVKKILHYKYKAGLNNYKPIETSNLINDLNPSKNEALQHKLYENAITVLKNSKEILPIKIRNKNKIAYVKLGDSENSLFVNSLKKYTEITEVSDTNIDSLTLKLKKFNTVIIGYHKSDKAWANQDFSTTELFWLQELAKHNNVILDVFAKPYTLLQISKFDGFKSVIVSYQNCDISQEVSAELIFGTIESKGKIPVSINTIFKVNDGLSIDKIIDWN